ncbi:MAG: ribonuclease HI family protein [Planctomycetota bacterium]|nr:ribonuclease HI family protein [Planctomycetota bacterium]
MNLTIYFDGGARGNPGPAAAGIVIRVDHDDPSLAKPIHEAGYFLGRATNNVAEYSALIRSAELVIPLKPAQVSFHSDSELLVRQITGQYRVKSPDLLPLYEKAQALLLRLDSWHIRHVYREANSRADELANLAIDAKKDVVVHSSLDAAAAGAPAPASDGVAKAAPPKPRPTEAPAGKPPTALRWTATFPAAPPADQCPAPCPAGKAYAFGPTTEAGLCAYGAQAVLAAVDLDPDAADQPQRVKCHRCAAVIKIEVKD